MFRGMVHSDNRLVGVTIVSIRILVSDDHEIVRRGICRLVSQRPGWEVCGEAGNAREAVERARELKPDIAIVDIAMPEGGGFAAIKAIIAERPQTKVLVLTMHESESVLEEVMRAGAKGLAFKS